MRGFNTQPPEGGWCRAAAAARGGGGFNTQPPEGGWDGVRLDVPLGRVSTHSRLKAAGSPRPPPL